MKKLLNILCGLLMSASAFAQSSYFFEESHMFEAKSTIIREAKYPATVTCVNTTIGAVLFIYADASYTTKELVLMEEGLEVHDMCVSGGDTVFFCGEMTVDDDLTGVIGYFQLSDLQGGSANVVFQNKFISGQAELPVKKLTRMVTYNSSNGDRHIVCIGNCLNDDGELYPCVVDMSGTLYLYMGYSSGYVASINETFEDISYVTVGLHNTPYLITAGFDNTYFYNFINFRVYDPENVMSTFSTIGDTKHLLSVSNGGRQWYRDGLVLSSTVRGEFATVSYRNSSSSNINYINANIHIGFYSVANIVGGNLSIMNRSVEIPFTQTTDRFMKDIIYNPSNKYMVFLHDATYLSSIANKSYYCEMPLSTTPSSGTLNYFSDDSVELHSLGLYSSKNEYIRSGFFTTLHSKLAYGMDTYGMTDRCSDHSLYQYSETAILTTVAQEAAFDRIAGICMKENKEYNIIKVVLKNKCAK